MADIELVIKIDEDDLKKIIEYGECDYLKIINSIENGIPIPDNATKGDTVETLFSETLDDFCERTTWEWNRWWNAPIRKAIKNDTKAR